MKIDFISINTSFYAEYRISSHIACQGYIKQIPIKFTVGLFIIISIR